MGTVKKFGTIVVTGGAGFVGGYLVRELQAYAEQIVVWDTKIENVPAGVTGLLIDITKPATYRESLAALQPQWIVHLAAVASVPFALEHPQETKAVNVAGTQSLLSACQEISPATKVLVVSSADIYGVASPKPIAELPLSQCQPHNPYAESKLEMEKIIEQDFNDRVIRVRPFPHIGPGQAKGFVTADFASQIAAIEAGSQKPVLLVGSLSAQRDFTDVRDVVKAYRLLMKKGVIGEVYNVASGKAVAIEQVLQLLVGQATKKITVEADPTKMRPADTPIVIGDASKLKAATGWQPAISLEQSLQDILAYWRSARTS